MGTDCKSVSNAYAGSNPARPNYVCKIKVSPEKVLNLFLINFFLFNKDKK
jgi:hypothetical protein